MSDELATLIARIDAAQLVQVIDVPELVESRPRCTQCDQRMDDGPGWCMTCLNQKCRQALQALDPCRCGLTHGEGEHRHVFP